MPQSMIGSGPAQPLQSTVEQLDFPSSAYDRPSQFLSNLTQGNVDAATRSLFAPDTLTPSELKTWGDMLGENVNKDNNPVLQTVLDISTNPLVVLGILAGIAFPVASPSALAKLSQHASTIAPRVSRLTSWAHTAVTNFRDVPGLGKALSDMIRDTTKFQSSIWRPLGEATDNYVNLAKKSLSEDDMLKVGAWLEGWHKPAKGVAHRKAMVKSMEKAGVTVPNGVLMPDLEKTMSPELIDLAKRWKKVLADVAGQLKKGDEKGLFKAAEGKGIQMLDEGYLHRVIDMSGFEASAMKKMTRSQYRQFVNKLVKEAKSTAFHKRTAGSLPKLDNAERLVELGAADSSLVKGIRAIDDAGATKMKEALRKLMRNYEAQAKQVEDHLGVANPELLMDNMRQLEGHYGQMLRNVVSRFGDISQKENVVMRKISQRLLGAQNDPKLLDETIDFIGDSLGARPKYTLDAHKSMRHYIKSVGPSYAWFIDDYKNILGKYLENPAKYNMDQYQTGLLETLLQTMRGNKTFKQMQRSAMLSGYKQKVHRWLSESDLVKKHVPETTQKWLKDFFGAGRESLSDKSLETMINHYFYLSTLGLNLSSSSKNFLQPLITTLPMLGSKAMGQGLGTLSKRVPKYFRLLADKSVRGADEAFEMAFPEYSKAMGGEVSMGRRMLSGDIAALGQGKITASGTVDKVKQMMMLPFSTTETFNRMSTFYSSLHAAKNDGMIRSISHVVDDAGNLTQAGRFARDMIRRTQFAGGPTGMPVGIMELPAPARQFMHFPLRYAGFLQESMRYGAGGPQKLSLGTLGKSAATSAGAYEIGKNLLGQDLSQGLMFSAMPQPTWQGQPFYPMPLTPPIFSVAGAGVAAVHSGQYEKYLGDVAPLMVPGGLAASRMYKQFSPRYADYEHKTPDGRIPVYNKDYALKGKYTPAQMVLTGIGLKPTDVQAEQETMGYLLNQREQIRQYRREYLEAIYENDFRKAGEVNQEFKQRYPELGEMKVRKSDIRALEDRKHVSRVNRVLEGFPAAYRPLFKKIIGEASFGRITENISADPYSIEQFQGLAF